MEKEPRNRTTILIESSDTAVRARRISYLSTGGRTAVPPYRRTAVQNSVFYFSCMRAADL